MRLGLISDTHDNVPATIAAMELLRQHKAQAILHAGDLVAPDMLEHFIGLPFYYVFGNNEYDLAAIRSRSAALGLNCLGNFADLTFENKRIALLHGHDSTLLHKTLRSNDFDYLIHGHTHQERDQRLGKTRIINPGAVHRANPRSVAILDLPTDTLEFLEIPH